MPAPGLITFADDYASRRAVSRWLFFSRLTQGCITLALLCLPLIYCFGVVALSVMAMWHIHLMFSVIHWTSPTVKDGLTGLAMLGEVSAVVLLMRQLMPRAEVPVAAVALMRIDQQELFDTISAVATKLNAPSPTEVMAETGTQFSTQFQRFAQLCTSGRGLRLRLGMSGTVGLTAAQFIGLIGHEMAFYARDGGARSGWLIRRVHRWFDLRIQHDPWLTTLKELLPEASRFHRLFLRLAWLAVWLSLRPLRLLYMLGKIISASTLRRMVFNADSVAANLVGSEVFASALEHQALVRAHYTTLKERLRLGRNNDRLPDNLPSMIARLLAVGEPAEVELKTRAHWLPMAPTEDVRIARVRKLQREPMIVAEVDATLLFRNFNEHARQATYFLYQNDWGLQVMQQRLVAAEEMVHEKRASNETVAMLQRYFKGLAHPERAFCGIAEENMAAHDPELLRIELEDCRDWLDQYGERMSTSLVEWTHTWQMVRDLEMAHMLTRAGLTVHRYQYAVADDSPEAYRREIDKQRHIMDSLEGVLRQYEGKLETRLASSLELLWQADPATLPERFIEVRATLPHWMLIYEGLGMQLPLLRELMTQFSAFQALGTAVASVVDSASYYTTLQTTIPSITGLLRDILYCLSATPYPFKTNWGEQGLTLAQFLAPQATLDDLNGLEETIVSTSADRRVLAQQQSKRLSSLVAPFIDRYLGLYHQSFAWIAKVADMAEWQFVPHTQDRPARPVPTPVQTFTAQPPPPPVSWHDPELDYSTSAHVG